MRSKRSLHQAEAADLTLLARRLEALGLHGVTGLEIHANRTVLVSVTRHGILRIHRGFAYASDRVLEAVVLFVSPASTSDTRREAEALVVGFPVERYVPSHERLLKSRPGIARCSSVSSGFTMNSIVATSTCLCLGFNSGSLAGCGPGSAS